VVGFWLSGSSSSFLFPRHIADSLNSERSVDLNLANDQTAPTTFLFWQKKIPQFSIFGKFSILGKKNSLLFFFEKLFSQLLRITYGTNFYV